MSREHYSYYNARSVLQQQNREMRKLTNRIRQEESERKHIKQMQKFQHEQLENLKRKDKKRQEQIQNMSYQMQEIEGNLSRKITGLDTKIDAVRAELKNDIVNLRSEIEAKETSKREIASVLIKDATDALNILDTYKHEKFKPGAYEKIAGELEIAKVNFGNDMYEASVSKAQDVLTDAYELRAELMMLEEEWNHYREEAFKATGEVLVACEASELVEYEFEGDDDEMYKREVDVDYWSKGELSKLKEESGSAQKQIDNDDRIETDDLKAIIQKSEEAKNQLEETIDNAQGAYLLSQIRNDMALDIENALYEDGYEVVDSTYTEEDQREPLWVKYENPNKDEIITIIKPRSSHEVDIEYHFSAVELDDALHEARANNIDQKISEATGVEKVHSECIESPSEKHQNILEMDNLDNVRATKINESKPYNKKV